jgi:hypothetical protein
MNRRNLITGAAALSVPAPGASAKNAIYELRYFRMRNGAQMQRTSDFLSKFYLPAAQRLGIGPVGFFQRADRRAESVRVVFDELSEPFRHGNRHGEDGG